MESDIRSYVVYMIVLADCYTIHDSICFILLFIDGRFDHRYDLILVTRIIYLNEIYSVKSIVNSTE